MGQLTMRPPDLDAQGQPVTDQPPDLDATGQPVGGAMNFAVVNGQRVPVPTSRVDRALDSTGNFLEEALAGVDPRNLYASVKAIVTDTPGSVKAILQANDAMRQKSLAAFQQGDIASGVRHGLMYLSPYILGTAGAIYGGPPGLAAGVTLGAAGAPRLDQAGDLLQQGEYARGAGAMTDVGLQTVAAPAVAGKVSATVAPILKETSNKVLRQAVQWGQRNGVPVDAATATGSELAGNTEKALRGTLGGSAPMEAFDQAAADGLERAGGNLATRANAPSRGIPGQPQTNVSAGESVRRVLEDKVNFLDKVADRFYERIRQVEARQRTAIAQTGGIQAPMTSRWAFTTTPLAVDIAAYKQAIAPLYQELAQQAQLAPATMIGKQAQVYVWLDKLMNAPDLAPLTVVDKALGNLKGLTRGAPLPGLTTDVQRAAAIASKELDARVMASARQAGVERELINGRAATVRKYQVAETWELLRAEPAQVYGQLTARADTQLNLLKQVQALAPREVPNVARAWLDEAITRATAEGKFTHADRLWADWQRLGPQTKSILFGKLAPEIDNWLLLSKQLTKNANASGSANTLRALNATQVLAYFPAKGLAKILTTPSGVRLLTRAMKLSANAAPAARANLIVQLERIAQQEEEQ